MQKQVDKEHYEFSRYIHKRRWASMWHQIDEVLALQPNSVLEIGPGPGVFQAVASGLGVSVETLDLDPDLNPDYLAPADAMPFADNSFDVLCAFQMLEHVPYDQALNIFREMARIARKGVVISLPDSARRLPIAVHIPWIGLRWFSLPKPRFSRKEHRFNGEHYWELNKVGYSTARVSADLVEYGGVRLERTFRVGEFPYHRFLCFVVAS